MDTKPKKIAAGLLSGLCFLVTYIGLWFLWGWLDLPLHKFRFIGVYAYFVSACISALISYAMYRGLNRKPVSHKDVRNLIKVYAIIIFAIHLGMLPLIFGYMEMFSGGNFLSPRKSENPPLVMYVIMTAIIASLVIAKTISIFVVFRWLSILPKKTR